jgi:hypothetical protein
VVLKRKARMMTTTKKMKYKGCCFQLQSHFFGQEKGFCFPSVFSARFVFRTPRRHVGAFWMMKEGHGGRVEKTKKKAKSLGNTTHSGS